MGGINGAHACANAKAFQRAHIGQHDPFESRRHQQEFHREGFTGRIAQNAVRPRFPARFLQQAIGPAQIFPLLLRLGIDGVAIFLAEHFRRHLVLHLLQNLQLLWPGQALGRKLRVGEEGIGARILAVEEIAVRPFEIEGEIEGFAHAPVLKLLPAQIEHEGLHALRIFQVEFLQDHIPALNSRKVIGRGPVLGVVLVAPVVLIGLEGLQCHRVVAEIDNLDLVKVVIAHIHRQIAPPVILHPFKHDALTRLEALDAIGPGSQGHLQSRLA